MGGQISISPPITKFLKFISFLLFSSEKTPIVCLFANLNFKAFSPSNEDVSTYAIPSLNPESINIISAGIVLPSGTIITSPILSD